jgi:flavin reductase (DIM6/NTAB) family NADH-FMN oxidoreductase RutF
MTMSSFTSLTLAPPSPLISFNVATPSRTLDAIAAAGRFNVHVLSGDARGAAVANHFTRGNADLDGSVFDGLDGVVLSENGGRMPPLLEGEGVLYVLRCKLAVEDAPSGGLVPVRDHVIVVGQIEEVMSGTSMDGEFGLAYADRRYRKEGDVISR